MLKNVYFTFSSFFFHLLSCPSLSLLHWNHLTAGRCGLGNNESDPRMFSNVLSVIARPAESWGFVVISKHQSCLTEPDISNTVRPTIIFVILAILLSIFSYLTLMSGL